MRLRQLTLAILCVSAFALPAAVRAQPLVDRVPNDAIIYVGWRGAADIGPEYKESHLKGVLDASGVRELLSTYLPQLADRVAKEDEESAEAIRVTWETAQQLWKHRTAVYFGGIDAGQPDASNLKLAVLCDAGAEAAQVLESFTRAAEACPDEDVELQAKQFGNLVVLSTYAFTEKPEAALAADESFKQALTKTAKDSVFTTYIEHEKLLGFIDLAVGASENAQAQEGWPKAKSVLQLEAIKRIAWTSGFDGKEWADNIWIHAPGPRSGWLAAFEGAPVEMEALRTVPKDSTMVSVSQFDAGKFFAEVRKVLAELDPEQAAEFEKKLAEASLASGTNIENDLIKQLGSQWTMYASPSVGGRDLLGMVVVNRPKDAAKLSRSAASIEAAVNNMIAAEMDGEDDPRVRVETAQVAGLELHYWAIPFVSPAWAVKDGSLYIGAFPQTVVSASRQDSNGGGSILDNGEIQGLAKRLGTDNLHGFSYTNLPVIASDGYASVLAVSRLFLGLSDLFGVKTPPMVVPPLDQLEPHLTPMASVFRVDESGWTFKTLSPFPGSAFLAAQGSGAMSMLSPMMSGFGQMAMMQQMQRQQGIDEPMEAPGDEGGPDDAPRRPLRPRPGPRPDDGGL